jgi:hypothetical protein
MGMGEVDLDGTANCKGDGKLGLTAKVHLSRMSQFLVQPGSLKFTATESDASKGELFCVNINFDVEDEPQPDSSALAVVPSSLDARQHASLIKDMLRQPVMPLGSTVSFTYSSCHADGDKGDVKSVTFDGDQLGKPIIATLTASSTEQIVQGLQYTLTLSAVIAGRNVPLISHSDDWCKASTLALPMGLGSIETDGLSCPAAAGDVSTKVTVNLAETVRFPKSNMHLVATDAAGSRLLCVDIDTTISEPSTALFI